MKKFHVRWHLRSTLTGMKQTSSDSGFTNADKSIIGGKSFGLMSLPFSSHSSMWSVSGIPVTEPTVSS